MKNCRGGDPRKLGRSNRSNRSTLRYGSASHCLLRTVDSTPPNVPSSAEHVARKERSVQAVVVRRFGLGRIIAKHINEIQTGRARFIAPGLVADSANKNGSCRGNYVVA